MKPEEPRSDDQWWFWTPEWQAMEAEADAALTAGDSVTFDNDADFLAWLAAAKKDNPEERS